MARAALAVAAKAGTGAPAGRAAWRGDGLLQAPWRWTWRIGDSASARRPALEEAAGMRLG